MNTAHDDSELVQLGPRTAASRAMFEAMRSRLNVARLLISERVRRRLTQQQLAAIAGTRQSRVSEIESADANFRFDTLDRIARALDLEVTLRPRAAHVIQGNFSQVDWLAPARISAAAQPHEYAAFAPIEYERLIQDAWDKLVEVSDYVDRATPSESDPETFEERAA